MTETRQKNGPAGAEFFDGAGESVQIVHTAVIESPCSAT